MRAKLPIKDIGDFTLTVFKDQNTLIEYPILKAHKYIQIKQKMMRPYWRTFISQGSLPVIKFITELFTTRSEEDDETLLSQILKAEDEDFRNNYNQYGESSSIVYAAGSNKFPALCHLMSAVNECFNRKEINDEVLWNIVIRAMLLSLRPSSVIPNYRITQTHRLQFFCRFTKGTSINLQSIFEDGLMEFIDHWCIFSLIHEPIVKQPETDRSIVDLAIYRYLLKQLKHPQISEIEKKMLAISSSPHGLFLIASQSEQEALTKQIFSSYSDGTQPKTVLA